eukprot:m.66222 g.66222  ORF g.66222 m.66222 type:complete len:2016 (-) comp12110_c1_seq1:349-6396(-)
MTPRLQRQSKTALAVLAVLAACLSSAIAAALYPQPTADAGRFKPIKSTNECGAPATTYCPKGVLSGPQCLQCDATCPIAADISLAGTFSPLAQPQCRCGLSYPALVGSKCCATAQSTDCVSRLDADSHPVQFMVDDNPDSYFQSKMDVSNTSVTLDLGINHEVISLTLSFAQRVPYSFAIQRSLDGKTFVPYQYFSADCEGTYDMAADATLQSVDQVICDSRQTDVRQTTTTFQPLTSRRIQLGGGDYSTSPDLQAFATTRYLRIEFAQFYTAETAVDAFGSTYDAEPFYRVTDFEVQARCACNGHASSCGLNEDLVEACMCKHDTTGTTCDKCEPLFNDKPWARDVACVKCDCNNHAQACYYNQSLDAEPMSRTSGHGGVCLNCHDNTAGRFCESCVDGYFKNPEAARSDVDSCIKCQCASDGVTDGACDIETGACNCKTNVEGNDCTECKPGFYGLTADNPDGCRDCDCNLYGTANATTVCNPLSGKCPCIPSNTGRSCTTCSTGWYQSKSAAPGQCSRCHAQCSDQGCVVGGSSVEACNGCRNFEEDGFCVEECSSFRFNDSTICRECDSQCAEGCSGPGPTNCDACQSYSLNGKCVSSCPLTTYADASGDCLLCDEQCNGCTGAGPQRCSVCRNFRHGTTCVETCPLGTAPDPQNVCQPCNSACDATAGCTGLESYQCNKCAAVYDVSHPLYTFDCKAACPAKTYASVENAFGLSNVTVCRACSVECARGCSGPESTECIGECTNLAYGEDCVPECPSHTYEKGGAVCANCHQSCDLNAGCFGPNFDQCIECASSVYVDGDECVVACPIGKYPDEDRICRSCNSACTSCYGARSSQCYRCKAFAYNEVCLAQCPELTYAVDTAGYTTTEPDYSGGGHTDYPDELQSPAECFPCHEQCSGGCTGAGAYQCTSCANVEYQGTCLEYCPATTYVDDSGVCQQCHRECASGCTGPLSSDCYSCRAFALDDTCVASCPSNFVSSDRVCLPCDASCSSTNPGCTDVGPTNCFECAAGFVRLNTTGLCTTQCPNNMYLRNGVCYTCDAECQGCTGPGPSECLSCLHVSLGDTCIDSCPDMFYNDASGACFRCNSECLYGCFTGGASGCLAPDGAFPCKNFQDGVECVAACDLKLQYVDDKMCKSCSDKCGPQGCSGPTASDCVQCRDVQLDGTCIAECPLTHYDDNGVCRRCNSECTAIGQRHCTNGTASDCTECRNVELDGKCLQACPPNHAEVEGVCKACDVECLGGCTGVGPDRCIGCAHFEYDGVCVAKCPATTFVADDNTCVSCSSQCSAEYTPMCRGATAADCTVCATVLGRDGNCASSCPTGTYANSELDDKALGGVCTGCHQQCHPLQGCTGPSADQCNTCVNYQYHGSCVSLCPSLTFLDGTVCRDCDVECAIGCSGSDNTRCTPSGSILETTATNLGCVHVVYISSSGVPSCLAECPVGTYPDAKGVCRKCSSLCAIDYGCSGPTAANCISCPDETFLAGDKSCQPCHSACRVGDGLSCTGATAFECDACDGVRFNGECIADCASLNNPEAGLYYFEAQGTLDKVCTQCHSECAPGGCSGPGPTHCTFGCRNNVVFLDDDVQQCVSTCGSNSYVTDEPVVRTCHACSPQCRNGCTDNSTLTCTNCARYTSLTGECVATCGGTEIPVGGVCTCPFDRAFISSSGECMPCSDLCAGGCSGPLATQCLGGADGCAVAELDGACVAACPSGMVKLDKVCVCKEGHYNDGAGCSPCDEQCYGGCTGPLPSQCTKCKRYKSGNTCVNQCSVDETPNQDNFCSPCHPECDGGCFAPGDALQCFTCKSYSYEGRCRPDCPAEAPFADGIFCVKRCPSTAAYYNDTRLPESEELGAPQTCLTSCPNGTVVTEEFPLRCTNVLRAQSESSAAALTTPIIAVIAVAAVCLLLLVVLGVTLKRRKKEKSLEPVAVGASFHQPRVHHNAIYGTGDYDDTYMFDPDLAAATDENGYLDTSYMSSGTDYMSVAASPQARTAHDPYSMQLDAMFDSSHIESTQL